MSGTCAREPSIESIITTNAPMARRYAVRTESGSDSGQVPWPERTCTTYIRASGPRELLLRGHASSAREDTGAGLAHCERPLCVWKREKNRKWLKIYRERKKKEIITHNISPLSHVEFTAVKWRSNCCLIYFIFVVVNKQAQRKRILKVTRALDRKH